MRQPFVLNRRLNELYKREQNQYMANKLERAKPLVNIKCPESFTFYKRKFHKSPKENIGNKYFFLIYKYFYSQTF